MTIVDRYSRFVKIGGEMISLRAVEESVSQTIVDEDVEIVAVALPDVKKGEKVVVLVAGEADIQEIRLKMKEHKVNPLMMPADFVKADVIPKLGSGKNDFARARNLAFEMAG